MAQPAHLPSQGESGQQDYWYSRSPGKWQQAIPGPGGGYPAGLDPRLAEPWQRLVGWIIDSLIIAVLSAALWIRLAISLVARLRNVANAYPGARSPAARAAYGHVISQTAGPFLIVLAATFCISVGYYWLLTGYWGTTFGKRIVGIWVVTANGWAKVGMGAALVRTLVFVAGGEVIPFFSLLDNLWLLWDTRRQCLHDKAASTVVVKSIAFGASRSRSRPAALGGPAHRALRTIGDVSRRSSIAGPRRSGPRPRRARHFGREQLGPP